MRANPFLAPAEMIVPATNDRHAARVDGWDGTHGSFFIYIYIYIQRNQFYEFCARMLCHIIGSLRWAAARSNHILSMDWAPEANQTCWKLSLGSVRVSREFMEFWNQLAHMSPVRPIEFVLAACACNVLHATNFKRLNCVPSRLYPSIFYQCIITSTGKEHRCHFRSLQRDKLA